MDAPTPHAALGPLLGLVGTWRGSGRGSYPTIEPFAYGEEVTFGEAGKPFLAYSQRTWDRPGGGLRHVESGYLRALGEGRVELVVVQPSGVLESHDGSVVGDVPAGSVELRTVAVLSTATAKEVQEVRRAMSWTDDVLRYVVDMAAVGQPLGFHLEAELRRVG